MEVHHHSKVEKKNLKEYFLEGLMIFIAVMLGFFAENLRENISEHNSADKLGASLIKDIQNDTSQLHNLTKFYENKIKIFDSLYNLLDQPLNKINQKTYYYLLSQCGYSLLFVPSNGTSNELKNAGYLRYFENDSLASLLSAYDNNCLEVKDESDEEFLLLYDKFYSIKIRASDSKLLYEQLVEESVPEKTGISSIAPEDLKSLLGIITELRVAAGANVYLYGNAEASANNIISYLHRRLKE